MRVGLSGVRGPLLAALAGTVLVSGCAGERVGPPMSIPPASASPQEVVTAYVAAINAHDRAAGRKLSTPHFAEQQKGGTDSPFDNVVRISKLQVEAPIGEKGYQSPDGKRYTDAVSVPVTFMLKQHEEISMLDGDMSWGYILVRAGVNQPWRINDHGLG